MEYEVISSESMVTLKREVIKHLKVGWECQGGISVVGGVLGVMFYQAMIREIKE